MNKFVLALGYFDCIHIGHQKILQSALEYALKKGITCKVATFDDGFLSAIKKDAREVFMLEEKKDILFSIGVGDVLVFPTESEFLNKTKYEFCDYLNVIGPECIFVGSDYRFGKNAEGNVEFLKNNCNCDVVVTDIVFHNGKKVSSSDIREMIESGNIEEANKLLSYPYFIDGIVTEGRKDGRKMQLPTINIFAGKEKSLPKFGVYITETIIDNDRFISVTNVGPHPTFSDQNINIESHLIDFNGDIYGKKVKIIFKKFLRDIKKYSSMEELKKQIQRDVELAKEYDYDKIRSGRQQ